jgi:hypothetical protein
MRANASFVVVLSACIGCGGGTPPAQNINIGSTNLALTLSVSGSGKGVLKATGLGDCRDRCTSSVARGTRFTLSATPDSGSVFAGWGQPCSGSGSCDLLVERDQEVSATFTLVTPPPPPGKRVLAVVKNGNGSVHSVPVGIECGGTCSTIFDERVSISLAPTADSGWRFVGWGGGCSGPGPCSVTLRSDTTVWATFEKVPPPPTRHRVTVTRAGAGSGRVTSNPGGIDCGSACSAQFDHGSTVSLSASADTGSTFSGWSGSCAGKDSCVVAITTDLSVTGTFAASPPTACPSSFDPMPQGPAAPPVITDPHPGDLLRPAWEIRPSAGYLLRFDGTVDPSGNLYWLESKWTGSGTTYQLASADIDGVIRFRAAGPTKGNLAGLLFVADTLVLLNLEDGGPIAEGYSAATGVLAWRRELLPLVQDWYRDASNNSHGAVFNGAVTTKGAVILSLGTGYKTESGYLSLDGASGAILWVTRTTDKDTLSMSSFPRLAADGSVFGSQTLRDNTALFRFTSQRPPERFFAGPPNEVIVLLSAPGPVLVASARSDSSFGYEHAEIRCQSDGALLAKFETDDVFFLAAAPDSAWLRQRGSGALSRYDVRTGKLEARVAASPSAPFSTSRAGILWVEQDIAYPGGSSGSRTQGPPTLRVLSSDGTEVRRRALPQEAEAYNGSHAASVGDRILLEGELLPSAGASGVIRAIDLPGWSADFKR